MAGWDRIEAIARSTGLTGGLEARVADPLWLLARQWQVGEFHGDDAAQPAVVRITGRSTPLATFRAGRGARPVPIPVGHPVEAVAEATAEPGFGAAHLYASAQVGRRRLARLLRNGGLPAALAWAAPERVTRALATELRRGDLERAGAIVDGWRAWYRRRGGIDTEPGWDDERVEYTFSVAARGPGDEITLRAPEHDGTLTGTRSTWPQDRGGARPRRRPGARTGPDPGTHPSAVLRDVRVALLGVRGRRGGTSAILTRGRPTWPGCWSPSSPPRTAMTISWCR